MQIGLLAVRTQPLDYVHLTTEISPGGNTNSDSDTNPPATQEVRNDYPGRSTSMTDHGEDDTTERLLEPSDTPISEGTIRAVVVVGLITLFVASFLYWQSWKERNNRTPCATKLRMGFTDVVNVQFRRARLGTVSIGDQRGQRSQICRAKPGRVEPSIPSPSPVLSSCLSTSSLPTRTSAIYHSPTPSEMILIRETVRPTRDNVGATPTVGQSPKDNNSSILSIPNEQFILHV